MSSTTHDVKQHESPSAGDDHSADGKLFDEEKLAEEKQVGIVTIEAARALIGWKLWVAYLGIFLTTYFCGLDNGTTYATLYAGAQATNNFVLYPTLGVLQQVVIAVLKFPVAKIADVFGRAEGFAVSLVFYVLGFILMAACQNFSTLAAGVFFYAVGNTGTQIMLQIIIADAVSTKWRGAAIGLLSWPYLMNFAVSGRFVQGLYGALFNSPTWRWGPGIFCIVFPIAISPIIFALASSQRQVKKAGRAPAHPYTQMTFFRGLKAFVDDIDLGGLFLIAAGFILILLPLTLYTYAPNGWNTDYIIAMFVVGGVLIVSIGFWEWLVAPKPVIRRRYILNKNVIIPAFIGFFDFFSFYLAWTSSFSYVQILKGWTSGDATYFSNAQSLCLTFFGIMVGFINLWTRQYKWSLVAGACIRMIGLGIMIAFRTANATTAQLVMGQILQGMGGGFLGVTLQVAAQVSVPHQDVAMVTAFVLLLTEIGGACGTALLGTIQAQRLPTLIARYLPGATAEVQANLYAQPLVEIISYPLGTPERTALIEAWNGYFHTLLTVAIALSAVPIVLGLLLNDYKLNDKQNCVTDEPPLHVTGEARVRAEDEIVKS
ncbi:putative siderophore iron transporter mirC [Microstroma glucosiphilum]|uniref:Putative siderophore iron transporter mirC n=1 Tax=Pseudomicrostroma glucosiphilum TaxID=1684307 RepID=A0A316U9X2_9BASI|nr:putative siderophore iron transporter mirC [Pseudomicrostroma glucosiphilum]PWN22030.1 putative siderophore iron transporter mirC [Pseudomicrostroma glucosiphilum]